MIKVNNDDSLDTLLKLKESKTNKLNEALVALNKANIEYSEKSHEIMLKTDFKEVLNESRPTVAQKEAYIDNELKKVVASVKTEETNVEVLKNEIRVLDASIKACMKYYDVIIALGENVFDI